MMTMDDAVDVLMVRALSFYARLNARLDPCTGCGVKESWTGP
jgi:hypothetical protein